MRQRWSWGRKSTKRIRENFVGVRRNHEGEEEKGPQFSGKGDISRRG